MDDRLIRHLTKWLMQSGWVKDYEHARAEAEGFANYYANIGAASPVGLSPYPGSTTSGLWCGICAGFHIPGAGSCTATYSEV